MSNSNQYNQGYDFGAASTQEQARGARDAEMERQRRDREYWDQMNALQRQQEEKSVAHDYSKSQSQPQASRTATSAKLKPKPVAKPKQQGSMLQGLIGLAGFIGGFALGGYLFKDSGIAIIITALICAYIAAESYKLIIGVAFVVFVIAAMVDSDKQKPSKSPASHENVSNVTSEPMPRKDPTPIVLTGFTQPEAAVTKTSDPKACVMRSVKGLLRAIKPITKVDTRQLTNDQRNAFHQTVNSALIGQDVSDCPPAFRAAQHNLLAAMEKSLDAGIRKSQFGGGVSWLNGVTDKEYEAIRKHMSIAFDKYIDIAVEIVPVSAR